MSLVILEGTFIHVAIGIGMLAMISSLTLHEVALKD